MRNLPVEERLLTVTANGIDCTLHLPNPNDHIARWMIMRERFYSFKQLDRLAALLGSGLRIVDIGANLGSHSVYFGKIMQASSLTSYEPQIELFEALERNIELNDITATLRPVAVSDENGMQSISNSMDGNSGATSFDFDITGTIPSVRLDDEDLGAIDFIKIDVEGAEPSVIRGALQTIEASKPKILAETLSPNCASDIQALLAPLGYSAKAFDASNTLYVPS